MRWVLILITLACLTVPGSSQSQLDSLRLEIAKHVDAVYPAQALKAKLEGEVVVRVAIAASGDVEKAELVSGDSALGASALAAADEWKFKTWKYGHYIPMPAWAKISFDFKMQDQKPGDAASTPAIPGAVTESGEAERAIGVSAGVTQGMILKKVAPVYPKEAKRARVEGSVVLHAVINKEGKIDDLSVVSGPPELVDAAVDAVKQWEYRPYFLKGEPVTVQTTITVNFELKGK